MGVVTSWCRQLYVVFDAISQYRFTVIQVPMRKNEFLPNLESIALSTPKRKIISSQKQIGTQKAQRVNRQYRRTTNRNVPQ